MIFMKNKTRVLQCVTGLSGGGVGSVVMNYYNYLYEDYVFDFVVNKKKNGFFEEEVYKRGGHIYEVPPMQYGILTHFKCLLSVLKQNKGSILHCNHGEKSLFFLVFGWLYGYKKRIIHIHSSVRPETKAQRFSRKLFTSLSMIFATDYLACGEESAQWFYGEKSSRAIVLKNAINLNDYGFNASTRLRIRNEWKVEDSFVIGSVGRLSPPKNHSFMLKVFKAFLAFNDKAILVLVGTGELEDVIKQNVVDLGIEKNVKMLGLCNNVNELLSAFDVFLMPSISEGVPVAAVEALASGLPVICSDVVTKEIQAKGRVKYISLNDPVEVWANEIYRTDARKEDLKEELTKIGYSIQEQANALSTIYENRKK